MKYYPLSRVVTGSKSIGEYTLNGVPYTGPYYKTFDGKFYTGVDPVTGDSKPLIYSPVLNQNPPTYLGDEVYAQLKGGNTDLGSFVKINPYYPKPTQVDYDRSFFFRYFAKKRNETGNLIEIRKEVHDSLQLLGSPYNYELYHSVQVYWQLTGPLKDTVDSTNGARTAGIEDTNKRLVEMKEENFKGLITYIGGNYSKFAKPVA